MIECSVLHWYVKGKMYFVIFTGCCVYQGMHCRPRLSICERCSRATEQSSSYRKDPQWELHHSSGRPLWGRVPPAWPWRYTCFIPGTPLARFSFMAENCCHSPNTAAGSYQSAAIPQNQVTPCNKFWILIWHLLIYWEYVSRSFLMVYDMFK